MCYELLKKILCLQKKKKKKEKKTEKGLSFQFCMFVVGLRTLYSYFEYAKFKS